jgi:Tfp pilus assembly protein PilX
MYWWRCKNRFDLTGFMISAIRHHRTHPGLTLVLCISLLVLLTMIGMGMLSLSSVSLRQSNRGQGLALARSNARVALMMAIGALQKSTGLAYRWC